MQKLSVAIITLNEERNIGQCLCALRGIADEIVVIDSFSKDRTEEICTQYGVKFIKNEFAGFGSQKNIALSHCTNKYVLSLDADEVLSEELKQSILNFKHDENPKDAYSFNRATHFCGKHIRYARWYPDAQLRLINKEKASWINRPVHEYIELNDDATKGFLAGDLLHYSYNSFEELILQTNKYSSISAKIKFDKGKRTTLLFVFLYTPWRFIRDFIFYRGYKDGYAGFLMSAVSTYEVFIKYIKLIQMQKEARRNKRLQKRNISA